jgi:hypothetical protein
MLLSEAENAEGEPQRAKDYPQQEGRNNEVDESEHEANDAGPVLGVRRNDELMRPGITIPPTEHTFRAARVPVPAGLVGRGTRHTPSPSPQIEVSGGARRRGAICRLVRVTTHPFIIEGGARLWLEDNVTTSSDPIQEPEGCTEFVGVGTLPRSEMPDTEGDVGDDKSPLLCLDVVEERRAP